MITLGTVIALNLALNLVILLWLYRRARARTADRICREFVEAFPGRCVICSFERHMLENGVAHESEPHRCPEGNSPPVPGDVPRAIALP